MDSRWKFLHCSMTEMWGHAREEGAGNEKTGASAEVAGRQIPPRKLRRDAETEWSEVLKGTAKKSRYCFSRTRTVNRHRWMRRVS